MRRRRRLHAALRQFGPHDRGTTAVEFGLICIPFLTLIFAILELAMVFLVTTTLETATEDAARRIRTGAFQQSGAATKADFRTLVCNNMSWLSGSCEDLTVEARTFASFAGLAAASAAAPGTFDPVATCWTIGQPSDIVLVRVYYKWRLFTPLLDGAMENMGAGSGQRLISTATAFRNEPYSDTPPQGARCT